MNNQPKLCEREIVYLLCQRKECGFNDLYEHYAPALYGTIIRMVKESDDADEILQDVFVKIWGCIAQFDPEKGRLYTWMINLARHSAIDYMRSKSFRNQHKNQPIPEYVYDDELYSCTLEVGHIGMKSVLLHLKFEYRMLIEMSYYEGYTQREIAQKLDIPIGTVKTRIRHALSELRTLLRH